MVLQVDAFPRRVGGDKDAKRVFLRCGVESFLDLLAGILAHPAVERADAFVDAVGIGQGSTKLLLQVPLGVGVLGEDHHAAAVPIAVIGTEVLVNPAGEKLDLGIGQTAGCLGNHGHALQKGALLGDQRGIGCGGFAAARCRGHGGIGLFGNLIFG